MHIYGYGSICRGEVLPNSDIDLLVISENRAGLDADTYSIYSYERIEELWREGNPFAWHLWLESRMLYTSNGQNYLQDLGAPHKYQNCARDCKNFVNLFTQARQSLICGSETAVFDLSSIFLSIRNIATCFSLGVMNHADFSRNSALHLGADNVPISSASYLILERARILCTRGFGPMILTEEVDIVKDQLKLIEDWVNKLAERAMEYERVQ